jgi:hypothetical protein
MLVILRALPDDVARRVVAADDEDASVVVADDTGAPDGGGGAPHHLLVVAAHLPLCTPVGVVVVVLLLAQPRPHDVRRRPVAAGGAPEDVLAVRPAGVHQRAVALALRRVAPTKTGKRSRLRAPRFAGPRSPVASSAPPRMARRRGRRPPGPGISMLASTPLEIEDLS